MKDVTTRESVLGIIAGALLVSALFVPMMLVSLPLILALALSIAAFLRKERPAWLPMAAGVPAVLFLSLRAFHGLGVPHEAAAIQASDLYADAKWQYGETKDEMRGIVSKNATLHSPTNLDLPPPYERTNSAGLFVDDTSGIMLTVEEGQLQCSVYNTVSIKVDDGPVWSYPCSTGDDGKYLFINTEPSPSDGQPADPKDLLTRGKRMTVEASFFDAGTRQMLFKIGGFDPSKLK